MNKLLVTLGALSVLSGCAGPMTSQQAQAWSEAFGTMHDNMAQQRAQYRQPAQPTSYTCRNYGRFTNCDPN